MTGRQIRITPLVRNAVIFSITISLVFAGVWSMQDSFLANAAKPQNNGAGKDVIAGSNGFPSGLHFNLIIHGKSSFDSCGGSGGNSVFTPEYSPDEDQKMQLYINKKANSFTLNVRDRCGHHRRTRQGARRRDGRIPAWRGGRRIRLRHPGTA